jgi:SAM-dependent methyltransferase
MADVGCGTGGTTVVLGTFGPVVGVEPSACALEYLRASFPKLPVVQGSVGELSSLIAPASMDLVSVLGVLYHRDVANPLDALRQIAGTLRDGGWLLWGDCLYPCLRRGHDELVETGRRFYPSEMHRLLRMAGFEVVSSSHFLAWGFPLALMMAAAYRFGGFFGRQTESDRRVASIDERPLPGWLNTALGGWTYWEWHASLWGLKMPVGVSRLVLARKLPQRDGQRESTRCGQQPETLAPCP